jgi:hypothetical protein
MISENNVPTLTFDDCSSESNSLVYNENAPFVPAVMNPANLEIPNATSYAPITCAVLYDSYSNETYETDIIFEFTPKQSVIEFSFFKYLFYNNGSCFDVNSDTNIHDYINLSQTLIKRNQILSSCVENTSFNLKDEVIAYYCKKNKKQPHQISPEIFMEIENIMNINDLYELKGKTHFKRSDEILLDYEKNKRTGCLSSNHVQTIQRFQVHVQFSLFRLVYNFDVQMPDCSCTT